MTDRAQFVILCEDRQAQCFIYRALVHAGAKPRRIRKVALPSDSSGGSGEAFVVKRYPLEVKAFRSMAARSSAGLAAHVDADTQTVKHRHDQLAQALEAAELRARAPDEAIAELIPRRNIETWTYALEEGLASGLGKPHNEADVFRKLECESQCSSAAESFADHSRRGTTPASAALVPSLLDGLREFARLP